MVSTRMADESLIAKLRAKIEQPGLSLPEKYRILWSLRNCANTSALEALVFALKDSSALFRHDVAFALGQRQDPAAVAVLKQVLEDQHEHGMVRHEAAEALGAIGTAECAQPLRDHEVDKVREVAETCVLARQRLEFGDGDQQESRFQSVDPTPSFPSTWPLETLQETLSNEKLKMFDRYRALFALRNKGSPEAVTAICQCLRQSSSALLKHEIAYVLGQLLDRKSVDCLKDVLQVCIWDCNVRSPMIDLSGLKDPPPPNLFPSSASANLGGRGFSNMLAPLSTHLMDGVCQDAGLSKTCLQDESEHAMVRHEAAEALGAIADPACIALLEGYSSCSEQIVADSCVVALDMIAHESSGHFEYADLDERQQSPCD